MATVASQVTSSTTNTSSTQRFSAYYSSVTYFGGSSAPPAPGQNTTDVIYQDVKLYIEGVQVPFESISVSQAMGQLPTAAIQIPPVAGLVDIARFYQPKVHIFYEDKNYGGFRLLFWGHITNNGYQRSRAGGGSASVQFFCEHKNSVLAHITRSLSGPLSSQPTVQTAAANSEAVSRANNYSSSWELIKIMEGVTGLIKRVEDLPLPDNPAVVSGSFDTTKIPTALAEVEKRLIGMPGAILNLWNTIKRDAAANPVASTMLFSVYIPLVEEALGYFKRLSGHYVIEEKIQNTKQGGCRDSVDTKIVIPPAYRIPILSSVQATTAVETIREAMSFSGEMASFQDMINQMFYSFQYQILTLASPAEVLADPSVSQGGVYPSNEIKSAVETITAPQLPFYYAPVCNVLFPRLYHTININQSDFEVPTRLTFYHPLMAQSQANTPIMFRAPHSVREAIAVGARTRGGQSTLASTNAAQSYDLSMTLGDEYAIPSMYEQGRGHKPSKIAMPWWLTQMNISQRDSTGNASAQWPTDGSEEYTNLQLLRSAWNNRYGSYRVPVESERKVRYPGKDSLNPYSETSGINASQVIQFAAADYEYTKAIVGSRTGTVDAVFNPYIIPGYPMDILDSSPNQPHFHCLCSSVTHTITSRSIGTTVGISAVMTYSELANYYSLPVPPWYQTALNIVNGDPGPVVNTGTDTEQSKDSKKSPSYFSSVKDSILNNPDAEKTADEYYLSVLGVGAASPTRLVDFGTGQLFPQESMNGRLVPTGNSEPGDVKYDARNGGAMDPFRSTVGNLKLVARPIETIESISSKFGYRFIPLDPELYNPSVSSYQNPSLGEEDISSSTTIDNPRLEPGASPFLDYQDIRDYLDNAQAVQKVRGNTLRADLGQTKN